jgi:calcineurin-like phosphoesterase family protein
MAGARPIRWLHLSDLHLGCRGEDLWWQVQEVLEKSVREMAKRLGPPDLLLLSGDLTNTGDPNEFKRVDRLLDTLRGWLQADPLTVAVPGNHDLQRPQGLAAVAYRPLERYAQGGDDEDVRLFDETLWDQKNASPIQPLFTGYQAWFRRRLLPDLKKRAKLHLSHFPGDFCLEVDIPGAFPLCLVGLNSTWQQYKGGDFERKLSIPFRQFQAALPKTRGASPLDFFQRPKRSLLMMHHPPDWLSRSGRQVFESIYTPDRFDLCLHGHMHEGRTESSAISGSKPRYFFQAPSLFGLEHYGTKEEDRLFGYAWGALSAEGEVRLWPLKHIRRGSGEGAFVHDNAFPEDAAGVLIRPVYFFQAFSPPPAPAVDFRGYLQALIDRTSHISISGISSGSVKGALRHPIEKLYTPLRSQDALAGLRGFSGLPDLLPRHSRLLLEGQPGAGKTTFLRLVACLLARDVLGIDCPDGPSWRKRHLGLDGGKPLLPVLLRISDLVPLLTREGARLLHNDRRRLLDLLEAMCEGNEHPISREAWSRRLEEGEAILLLDGLDEVADEELRSRIFEVFRDAAGHWKCPIVVTSRPIQTAAPREMGFHLATVEPFERAEIRTFINHWVSALYATDSPEALSGEGERYRAALVGAICDLPRIRRLATNPVMLTCLCVVHWNEGRLPEGRSRVYRAVLRWLVAARTSLREKEGFTDRFAWNAFARLALAMVDAENGKKAVFDLEAGAVAIDPAVRRQFPSFTAQERRQEARRWLTFECLGSGVVEELAGRRLRFWHLTFQEFLAALQLAWLDDEDKPRSSWWPLVRKHLDDAQWRETIELLPGCLLDEGGEGRVDKLLERVLALRGAGGGLATEARVAGVAGRLLQTLTAYQYQPRPEITAAYEAALERSMAIFTLEGAARVPVRDRIAVAEALGRGGDPRLAPDRNNFLEVHGLAGVWLGKYPVTVEEYQRFVESRGYEESKFWGPTGWELRMEEGWETPGGWEEQLETPNRPVTKVSWYEAVAYCRWLTEERQKAEMIRLPTVEEWETAATPARGGYPWGAEEPDPERANFGGNVKAATPVGLYLSGMGPSGHLDLAGNVLEWCSDKFAKMSDKDVKADHYCYWKGGGWFDPAGFLWTVLRGGAPAGSRHSGLGFRVVAAPTSLDD